MFTKTAEFFMNNPKRLVALGRFLLDAGGFLVVAGLSGRAVTTGSTLVSGLSGVSSSPSTLAELLPGVPTWWIPETALGYFGALAVAGVGIYLVQTGRELERFLRI